MESARLVLLQLHHARDGRYGNLVPSARGSSANGLTSELLGDYNYAVATREFGSAVWNDMREGDHCVAIVDYRQAFVEAVLSGEAEPIVADRPRDRAAAADPWSHEDGGPAAPNAECPTGFGNSSIFGLSYADPPHTVNKPNGSEEEEALSEPLLLSQKCPKTRSAELRGFGGRRDLTNGGTLRHEGVPHVVWRFGPGARVKSLKTCVCAISYSSSVNRLPHQAGPQTPRRTARAWGSGEETEAMREGATLLRHRRLVAGHLTAFGVRRGGGALRADDPRPGTRPVREVLELGSGGGNNASHMKHAFAMTLVEPADGMREISRKLNPECTHLPDEMRYVRLGRTFDAVFVHDAVMYMTTEDDLHAALETVAAHLAPGGVSLVALDATTETRSPSPPSTAALRTKSGVGRATWSGRCPPSQARQPTPCITRFCCTNPTGGCASPMMSTLRDCFLARRGCVCSTRWG